jgi:hypothetical protein
MAVVACGDGSSSVFGAPGPNDDGGGSTACIGACDGGPLASPGIFVESLRIEPENAVVTVTAGQQVSQPYKVLARIKGRDAEEDITGRTVFYVPDAFLVGAFPADGTSTLTTRLPASDADPPQRGGRLTVAARAASSDGTITEVRTGLTVKIAPLTLAQPGAQPALPAAPGAKFGADAPDPARAPRVIYPNDGVMLPPNLRRLDVHFDPGTGNDLFELRFTGPNSTVTYYARCTGGAGYAAGKCGFELDQKAYAFVAQTNAGETVKLRLRATDAATGGAFGEATEVSLAFSDSEVLGGLYYWTVTSPGRVMRVDFGNPNAVPEAFLEPGKNGLPAQKGADATEENCVGCHALSRDGTKLVASMGGQWDGRLLLLNDLTKAKGATGWLTLDGAKTGIPAKNRVQFAAWNPAATQFAAVYGDKADVGTPWSPALGGFPADKLYPTGSDVPDDLDPNKLWFHDGTTGARVASKTLPFKPSHLDWSPDGNAIAVTHVGDASTTTQRPRAASVAVLPFANGQAGDPIDVAKDDLVTGKSRYNPAFFPDSQLLTFNESSCDGSITGDGSESPCDGDADTSATTWAVAPNASAKAVRLSKADAPGRADPDGALTGNTFPRPAPFRTKNGASTLTWITVASRRAPGYKTKGGAQLLWMFAVDGAKVLAGQDGSFPAFFLPFQDFATSNHLAQWTERIVGSTQPPAPKPPVPPPPPIPR